MTMTLRCSACGEAFLVTQTGPDSLVTCPHCAHSALVKELVVEGAPSPGLAAPLTRKRRKTRGQAWEESEAQMQMDLNWDAGVPEALPEIEEPVRRGPTRTVFVPLDLPEEESPIALPPTRQALSPWKMLVGLLGALVLAGLGWWINHTPESVTEVAGTPVAPPAEQTLVAAPVVSPQGAEVATSARVAEETSAGETSVGAVAVDPVVTAEIDSARLTSEAPEVLRALLEGPAVERVRFVVGGERWADSVGAFFERSGPLQMAALRRLPVTPVDLVSREPAVLFQVATSANAKGALGRFLRGGDGGLRLDWELFQQTHDLELERFLSTAAEGMEPRWFRVGIRRSHGLGLSEALRESLHVFDLQASPGGLLGTPGYVARDLPVGRYLNQATDWRAIYLARLLLLPRLLPDGTRMLEILDCEGAGLRRSMEYPEAK